MAAAVCALGNELPKEQSQVDKPGTTTESKPQKPASKSKKSKPKAGKQTVKQVVDINEKKVKPRSKNASKAVPNRSKSNKKRRPKKKTSPRAQKAATTTRKENSSSRQVGEKKKSTENRTNNSASGERRTKGKRRGKNQPLRQIPLVLPFAQSPRVGIAHGPVKYTLTRAESNREHRQRVLSNRRKCRRRARTTKRKGSQHEYLANYWTEPEVKLDDLSSLDCGSYSDNMEEVDEKPSPTEECKNNSKVGDTPTTTSNFVFNISAPEFVPKEFNEKRLSNIFTLSDLVESVKGQQLPSMPIPNPSRVVA